VDNTQIVWLLATAVEHACMHDDEGVWHCIGATYVRAGPVFRK
jgi:hypothetical protein